MLTLVLRIACLLWAVSLAANPASCSRAYIAYTSAGLGYDTFRDAQGQLAGFSIDFYRELARRSACAISVEDVPPARLEALSNNGRVALLAIAGDRHLPDRQFVPLVSMSTDLLVLRDFDLKSLTTVRSDGRVIFGKVAGLTYGDWGNRLFEQIPPDRIDTSPTVEVLYRKLAAGRIGATFGFSLMYQRNIEQAQLQQRLLIVPLSEAPRGIAGMVITSALVDERDAQHLVAVAEAMRADGTVQQLLARWLGDAVARDLVWRAARDAPAH
ncbi:substrate-binding periplasmic protein [Chitinimonas sp.]|uniref:substrate-binding periplasmic protein n=1 Tax=Chitinimonas sp. TaxID=1934313 RepID=UPI0035AFF6F9